ncbi:MAG: OmpA family protein [Polyangia bacterium]
MRLARSMALCALAGVLCLFAEPAAAQNVGFQLNRYEPTPAGEWSFLVDHPWYSATRYFAAGVTLNYAHNPLVFGLSDINGNFTQTQSIITHQLIGHLDLAGSFLDRVTISASVPMTFLERGQRVGGLAPISGVAVGDPRVGLMVRVFGQPDRSAFSLSLGGYVWVPLRKFDDSLPLQSSDSDVRVLPKLVLGGLSHRVRWSLTAGFLYRPDASLGAFMTPDGSSTGSSVQLGAGIGYADTVRRFAIGPEALLSTVVVNGNAFKRDFTSLEVLLGAHYNIAGQVQLGVAGGVGVLREPGTPDARALFRLAYAPIRKPPPPKIDSDGDGIWDYQDACPQEAGPASDEKARHGCPPPDRDRDGVIDGDDLCPDVPSGKRPDPARRGCPIPDKDGDGVLDSEDQCIGEPQGEFPDPKRPGCPDKDSDSDGVRDAQDQCPTEAATQHADPKRPGCPDKDTDRDGVYDAQDQCPTVPASVHPDPNKPGCPLPDRDADTIVDSLDACPDRPGSPDPDPKKNGCPGLVVIKRGQIVILRSVFFANDKDEILKNSFPVMQAVANVLLTTPEITKLAIEGHTDDRGDAEHNLDLSDRRAKSCMRWLVEHGIAESRLTARGYGPQRPIANNATLYGRAKNRRVEFHILEPAALAQAEVQTDTVSKPGAAAASGPAVGTGKGAAGGGEPTDTKGGKKRRGKRGKADKDAGKADADAAAGDTGGKPAKKRHHRSKKSK